MELNAYIYFYHLDKFCILPDYPETITDVLPASFSSTNALARTAPVFSYQNSGPRTVSVSFSLHRDMVNDLNKNISNLKDNVIDFSGDDYVDTLVKYLQAASLPKYNEYSSGAKSVIPPMVAIRFGNSIFIKGVVNSSVQCTYKKPILVDDKYACIDVSFTVYEVEPYDAEYVVQQGSFRGLTKTFKNGVYKDTSDSPTVNVVQNTKSKAKTNITSTLQSKDNKKVTKQVTPNTSTTKVFQIPHTGVDGPAPGGSSMRGNSKPSEQADR